MQEQGTPTGETAVAGHLEPSAVPQTPGAEAVTPEPAKESPVQPAGDEAEKLRKQNQQLEMERNNLRNKLDKQREDELKAKEEYKTLYEEEKTKRESAEAQQAADQARKEAENFRNKVIDAYPDEATKRAARALIEKNPANLTWGDAESYDAAETDLTGQLDAIKSVMGGDSPTQTPHINPNNPAPLGEQPIDRLTALQEAQKSPRSRQADVSDILKTIPSVAAQVKRMNEEI